MAWTALAIFAGAVVAIMAVVATLLSRGIALDRWRADIESQVTRATGSAFHLGGPLHLRLYPTPVLTTGAGELDSPPDGAGPGAPMVSWRSASAQLQWRPLLRHQLVLERLTFDGLGVHVRRSKDGHLDVADLLSQASTGGAPGPGSRWAPTRVVLDAVSIRDGTIRFDDEATASQVTLSALQLDVGASRWGPDLQLGAVRMTGRLAGLTRDAVPVSLDVSPVDLAAGASTVSVPRWSLRVANASMSGAVQAQHAQGRPTGAAGSWSFGGPIAVKVTSVRQLAAVLGFDLPDTPDRTALGALDLEGRWQAQGGTISLRQLRVHLDDTLLSGWVERTAGNVADGTAAGAAAPAGPETAPRIALDLTGDHIDLTRYIAADSRRSTRLELPVAKLRALAIDGGITFDALRYGAVDMKGVRLAVR